MSRDCRCSSAEAEPGIAVWELVCREYSDILSLPARDFSRMLFYDNEREVIIFLHTPSLLLDFHCLIDEICFGSVRRGSWPIAAANVPFLYKKI